MEDEKAKAIGSYEIVETIREAPEGTLYKVVEKSTKNDLLLKIYYPSLKWSDEILNEFFNLTSHLRFIEHPYLLPILDVGKHQDLPYVVFSGDPFTFLGDEQSHPKDILDFFHKIADALDYLHKQEILHGSINTENIIVDAEGDPKLFDHGLSGVFKKLLLENLEDGFDNLSISNLKCTSPEQILGRNPTRASDIYSFGVVFFFVVFGEFPFSGKFPPETALAHLDQRMIKIEKVPGNISSHTLEFIEKCIQVEPESRFGSFAQILDVLERMEAGKKPHFQYTKRFFTKNTSLRPARWLIIAVLFLAMIFSGYYFYVRNSASQSTALTAVPAIIQSTPTSQVIQPTQNQSPNATKVPTEESIPVESIPGGITGQPAFEGQTPILPTEKISLSSIKDIKEFSRLGYGRFEDVDVSSDGKYFVFATSAGVFIFENDRFLKWIDPQDWATSVQFSNDGTKLAIGVDSGAIQMWDWENGEELFKLLGHTGKINKLLFAPNDKRLYSASADRTIIPWDLENRKIFLDKPIQAHSSPVNDIALSNDGGTLISGSTDGLVRFWNLNSGKKVSEFSFVSGRVRAVAISSDGQYLAVGGDSGFVQQWKIPNDYKITDRDKRNDQIPVKERVWSLQYVNDDSELLVGIDDGKTITYNAAQSKYEGVSRSFTIAPLPSKWADIFGPSFEFDSFAIDYGNNQVLSITWDGKVTNQHTVLLQPIFDNLDRLDISQDGTILAAGGNNGTTSIWNLKNNQALYKDHVTLPIGDPISPDGSSIVVMVPNTIHISESGAPIIEDNYRLLSVSGAPIRDFSKAISGGTVSYALDGNVFVSASFREPKIWDNATGYESPFGSRTEKGCRITYSANNDQVLQVYSAAGVFQAWDDPAGNLCSQSSQNVNRISAFSNNLSFLVYINSNGLLEGFDTIQNKSLWSFDYRLDGKITALAVSPDGSIVAYGNEAGNLTFVNSETGERLYQIVGNYGSLQAIEFSKDGMKVATTGSDGTVRLFGIVKLSK